jgi:predicted phosphate transport protein (TIGR00153 family)
MPPFRLLPREERFFVLFQQAADNLADAGAALVDLTSHYVDVESKVARLKELEHRGDQITHTIFEALNRAFVTPFDRDDVARLATSIDDVLDEAEEAARRLHTYKIDAPTSTCSQLCRLIAEQSRIIAHSIPLLDGLKQPDVLHGYAVELHRLENEADALMDEALAKLYEGVSEVPALIRAVQWSDIYKGLEAATDRAEDVAVTLETIIIKHA